MLHEIARAVRTIPDFPKPGIQFKDITPILADPVLLQHAVALLAAPFRAADITRVVGIEARGFILGGMLAHHLDAGFVPVRKLGKLPWHTVRETYALEYGTDTIEMHRDALRPGDRVLIHDDVIATGGTAAATHRLVQSTGAVVVGFAFLAELDVLNGRGVLGEGPQVESLLHF
jgi:adenine phosphoribosyltransferase